MLALVLLGCTDPDPQKGAGKAEIPGLVPLPALVEPGRGAYTLDADTTIGAEGDALSSAELLAEGLRASTGLALPVEADGDVTLVVDPDAGLLPEGYTLDVDEGGVRIVGADAAGVFYGTQTLRQLLSPWALADAPVEGTWTVPAVYVEDAPRFPWRGYMLDVARHFFTVEEVERQIDRMALHKLNRLHLHLTDDQGWRIEIKSWPNLALIGGSSEVGGGPGGYYTQEELAGLVAYAAERHVLLVPEIDFPGHAHAALASYPELNESGVAPELYTGTAVISTPLWLEGEITWEFVADVWAEVLAVAPSVYVHIGGDEAIDVDGETYAAFVQHLQAVVAPRTAIGWDEVGPAGLAPPFVAQHWYDADNARAAVAGGGTLIASPAEHAYLDMVHDNRAEFGQTWAGPVNVEAAYVWDPAPSGVDEADVLGVEGALWTEYVDDEERLELMTWPRLAALAEVGWTPDEARLWRTFGERLGWHGARLEVLGVGYYRSPEIAWTSAADVD